MEWILIANALCLSSHHEICINHTWSGPPYQLTISYGQWARDWGKFDTLQLAKMSGEDKAKDLDEFGPVGPVVDPQEIAPPNLIMPLYGMTKDEFGAFIEDHVRKTIADWFKCGMCGK
jgi:hypothetical protein